MSGPVFDNFVRAGSSSARGVGDDRGHGSAGRITRRPSVRRPGGRAARADRHVLLARRRRAFAEGPASLLRLLDQLLEARVRLRRVLARGDGLPLCLGQGGPRLRNAFLTCRTLRLALASPLLGLRRRRWRFRGGTRRRARRLGSRRLLPPFGGAVARGRAPPKTSKPGAVSSRSRCPACSAVRACASTAAAVRVFCTRKSLSAVAPPASRSMTAARSRRRSSARDGRRWPSPARPAGHDRAGRPSRARPRDEGLDVVGVSRARRFTTQPAASGRVEPSPASRP